MADVATPNPPSLSEDYLLPAEEKTEPVLNVAEVEETVQETTPSEEESAPENTSSDASEESSETPVDADEKSEEPATEEEAKEDDAAEEEEEATEDEAPEIKLETAPADFRFPTTNQTRHCFTRYVEFHKCTAAKGEGAPECDKFAKFYRSLCPGEWIERWNEQRENGTFPGPL